MPAAPRAVQIDQNAAEDWSSAAVSKNPAGESLVQDRVVSFQEMEHA
jgi:hypothetical protein